MLELSHEGFELGLLPEAGGSVAWFRAGGVDILRPAQVALTPDADRLELAAFPLFPFSGRIGQGRFSWRGREVSLPLNFVPEPHAIHGQAWQAAWDIVEASGRQAVLQYTHDADAWPWSYRAEQRFVLSKGGLSLDLRLTNLSDETMPAGIGWHPYFPRGDARILADTVRVWPPDEAQLPTAPRAPEAGENLQTNPPVNSLVLDHPFELRDGVTEIEWPSRRMTVRLHTDGGMRFLIVFTPAGQDYFCAEPVSHVPDMVNLDYPSRETGLVALAPGESLSASISLWPRPTMAQAGAATERTPAR